MSSKKDDIEIAARAEFEATKSAIGHDVEWDTMPDGVNRAEHPGYSKDYYRGEVRPTVEALWCAGRLS